MYGRNTGLLALAASALTAQAFLVPPTVTSAKDSHDLNALGAIGVDPSYQGVKLPYSESMVWDKEHGWKKGDSYSLFLNFTIDEAGHAMGLDGYTLYPAKINTQNLALPQVPDSASLVEIKKLENKPEVRVTGDSVYISEDEAGPNGELLVRIKYQILQIEHQMTNLDAAQITMIKAADTGKLMIFNVETTREKHHGGHNKQCGALPALLCQLKHDMGRKISGLKAGLPKKFGGCRGKKHPGHVKPEMNILPIDEELHPVKTHGGPPKFAGNMPHGGPPNFVDDRPHGFHGHHPHHPHHHHSVLDMILNGVFWFVVPVLAGFFVGMTVCVIGMVVGRLIAFFWIHFVRGSRGGYNSVAQEEEGEIDPKDETVPAEDAEPLPLYEEAPAYVEKEQQ